MISIYYSPKYNNLLLINILWDERVYVQENTMGSKESFEVIINYLIRSEYEFIGNFKE